jgi:hypothetical protein
LPRIAAKASGERVIVTIRAKSHSPLARVATNLAIGVVGLVIVRMIASALPMFHDAGWIVKDKLTVQASVVIAVDALLLCPGSLRNRNSHLPAGPFSGHFKLREHGS